MVRDFSPEAAEDDWAVPFHPEAQRSLASAPWDFVGKHIGGFLK